MPGTAMLPDFADVAGLDGNDDDGLACGSLRQRSLTRSALAMVTVAVIRSLVNWDPESGHEPV